MISPIPFLLISMPNSGQIWPEKLIKKGRHESGYIYDSSDADVYKEKSCQMDKYDAERFDKAIKLRNLSGQVQKTMADLERNKNCVAYWIRKTM